MTDACARTDCAVGDGLPCEMGLRDRRTCQHYIRGDARIVSADGATAAPGADEQPIDDAALRLPWTGRALGFADLALVAARGPVRVVGLIGQFNAGKTALLTAMFTHFAETGSVGEFDFAGSFTLDGWIHLRAVTTWPSSTGAGFPPHTPDNGQRVPSLLHLAFRRKDEPIRDALFTDAPGEWFSRWVQKQDADDAQGARWIAENATHFIFVVDRAGLAGPESGRIRQHTLALARVLSEHRRERPVIAVWTKSDTQVDEAVETPIRAKLVEFFGEHSSINLHVRDVGCAGLLEVVLKPQIPRVSVLADVLTGSPFLAFRGTAA